jgi:tetratricopeptide (TPR) repeat protein
VATVVAAAFLAASGALVAAPARPQDGADLLQRGVDLLAAGRTAEAVELLERAAALLPEDPRTHYQLGRALFSAGRPADAVAPLEAALEAGAEPGPVHFLLGQVSLETGDLEIARASLEAAAASRPGYPPIEFYRAELCYRLGRVPAARERFAALTIAAPDWPAPVVRSGSLALEQGDAAAAVVWFRTAAEITPEQAAAWIRLGAAMVENEQPYEALAAYRRAAQAEPGNLVALVAVAIQLVNLDEPDEAMDALDAVLALNPNDGAIRYHRARMMARAGNAEQAFAEIEAALQDLRGAVAAAAGDSQGAQTLAEALLFRAELLQQEGREDEAIEVAQALLAEQPDNPEALFLLGNILLRRDRSGAAMLARFKQLSDAREHRELADHFRLRQRDPERARAEYEIALRSDPDDAGSWLGLGAALRQTGAAEDAVEALTRARGAGAGGAEWHREWILGLFSAGRGTEARAAWEESRARGLTLGPEVWALIYATAEGC